MANIALILYFVVRPQAGMLLMGEVIGDKKIYTVFA